MAAGPVGRISAVKSFSRLDANLSECIYVISATW